MMSNKNSENLKTSFVLEVFKLTFVKPLLPHLTADCWSVLRSVVILFGPINEI